MTAAARLPRTVRNPFRLPRPAVISFSGGRTSAYMLKHDCTPFMLKGRAKLIRLIREDPALADWWIKQEAKVPNRTGPDGRASDSMKRFRLGETYAELKAAALAHRDLFDEAEPDSDGNASSDSLDCLCTD